MKPGGVNRTEQHFKVIGGILVQEAYLFLHVFILFPFLSAACDMKLDSLQVNEPLTTK